MLYVLRRYKAFSIHCSNRFNCVLAVQVKVPEKKTQLGVLNLPLSRLLNTSDMTLDQRFPLERSGANSQIKLKATLRVGTQRWQAHTHTFNTLIQTHITHTVDQAHHTFSTKIQSRIPKRHSAASCSKLFHLQYISILPSISS